IFVSKFAGKTKSLADVEKVRATIREQAIQDLRTLPEPIQRDLVQKAEVALKTTSYPVKTASEYLECSRNGNRINYENKVTAHQKRMALLIVGNLLDQVKNSSSTLYVDEIVNGVWHLMEESSWVWPAHITGGCQEYLGQNRSSRYPTEDYLYIYRYQKVLLATPTRCCFKL